MCRLQMTTIAYQTSRSRWPIHQGCAAAKLLAALAGKVRPAVVVKFAIIPKGCSGLVQQLLVIPSHWWNYGELWVNYGEFGCSYGELWRIMVELWGIMLYLWGFIGNYGGIMRDYEEVWGIMGQLRGIMGNCEGIMGKYGEL